MRSKYVELQAASFQPISAMWTLNAANALGADFLQWLIFDASIIRRQVSFAVLAKRLLDDAASSEHNLKTLAKTLQDGDPSDAIAMTFGKCACGEITGFTRIGHDAYADPAAYLRYHDLYNLSNHRRRLEVARHIGQLSEDRLNVIFDIDPAFLTVDWIRRLTPRRARLLTLTVAAIRENAPTEAGAALHMSIAESSPDRSFREALTAWLSWCRFPDVPVLNDVDLGISVVLDAETLITKARQYQNCSARLNRLIEAVAGRAAYLTYEPDGAPFAMASLLPSSGGGWLLEGVYGVKNAPLSLNQQAPLRSWLAGKGVHGVSRSPLADEWRAAKALVGAVDPELDDLDDLF